MYQPAYHREDRLEVQHALMRAHPLATLVTLEGAGLVANHIPFILDPIGPRGVLRGHLARANSQWQAYDRRVEALVIFQGVEHYITPAWYVSKQQTGKVVPTWNYVTVHAYGPMTVMDDKGWLAQQIVALTASQEGRRAEPWAVTDAPPAFIEAQIKAIVGIEIPITRIEGKWKVSQNRPEADRNGVVEGLRQSGDKQSALMAELVRSRGSR